MKIAASIITNGPAGLVRDALSTIVPYVDIVLFVDTGVSDGSIEIARECAAGTPIEFIRKDWSDDFSEVRNFAFDEATRYEADWAVTIDTDERIKFREGVAVSELKDFLWQNFEKDAVYVLDGTRSYAKERFLNCRSNCRWKGLTHETFVDENGGAAFACYQDVVVYELPKNRDKIYAKLERDERLLLRSRELEPSEGRWTFYLGQTMEGLGRNDEAIKWYRQCVSETLDQSLAAWAYYLMAKLLFGRNQFEESLSSCYCGLELAPSSPELLWLAGMNSFKLENYPNAAVLSGFAVNVLLNETFTVPVATICRDQPAWFELPFDLHAWSLHKLGKNEEADRFRNMADARKAKRLSLLNTGFTQ